ncbi:HXXEE domain-containing protein [Rhizobium glycinendophyticum]|nr:HXXEE domain-containing protein [Rhizobium glycinendophyticum]
MDTFWFWLFFGLLVLHNGEEYLFADRLADVFAGRGLHLPLTRLRIALVIVTLAGLALIPAKMTQMSAADPLLAGAALVMLANAVIPHLAATVILRRYTAGVVSAVLLMAPGCVLILNTALAAGIAGRTIVWAALIVAGPLLLFLWLFIGAGLMRKGHAEPPAPKR